MIMQEWSQPGAGRATDPEPERDPARTVPDRPEPPDSEESADWDELTPVGTGQVTPPADVLVAGAPLAEPGLRPGAGPAERAAPPVEPPVEPPTGPPAGTTAGSPPGSPAEGIAESHAEATSAHDGGTGILDPGAADGFHARWRDVQFGFVDDPRTAVRRADELADEALRPVTDALP